MRYLKPYTKLFESVDESTVTDILSEISDNEKLDIVTQTDSVIVGIGDENRIYDVDGSNPEDLRDFSQYVSDLQHLNHYLESQGYVMKNVAIWESSIWNSQVNKKMIYNFDEFIDHIKISKIIYMDIMWQKV
jgi:hypothetical protein